MILAHDLVAVAEGILDEKQYFTENTQSIESVRSYAYNGMTIMLTSDEAKHILYSLLSWQWGTYQGQLSGTDDYFHTVTQPLENYTPETETTLLITRDGCDPQLYTLNNLYDIFGRINDGIGFKAIEQVYLVCPIMLDFDAFKLLAESYETNRRL